MVNDPENFKSISFEIKRKLFHVSSILIPVFYMFTPRFTMTIFLTLVAAFILYVDISRHYNSKIKELVVKIFSKIMREEEMSNSLTLSGMSYFFMGCLLVVALFPKWLAITSMMILIICDAAAALIGKKFGKPLSNGKSIEGFSAFVVSAIIVSVLCYLISGAVFNFTTIFLASLVTAFTEFFSKRLRINDNLSIPLIYAFSSVIFAYGL